MNKEVRTFAGGQPFWYNPETTFCVIPLERERAAELHLGDFNMQDLANTAWAFATASHSDAHPFAVLARAAEQRLGDVTVQELANTAWAFATASQQDAQLFAVMARVG